VLADALALADPVELPDAGPVVDVDVGATLVLVLVEMGSS
jgi:hypothetical protein